MVVTKDELHAAELEANREANNKEKEEMNQNYEYTDKRKLQGTKSSSAHCLMTK